MTDDEPRRAHLFGGPLHREPVEAVAADPPLLAEAPRQRVGRGLLRQRRVKRGVEHGDVGDMRKYLACLVNRCERRRVVERREFGQGGKPALYLVVDQDGLAEARAAVNDSVTDRLHSCR